MSPAAQVQDTTQVKQRKWHSQHYDLSRAEWKTERERERERGRVNVWSTAHVNTFGDGLGSIKTPGIEPICFQLEDGRLTSRPTHRAVRRPITICIYYLIYFF